MARRRTTPEARRRQLIAAARRVFAEKGVGGAAVGDIVRAAGVAQGTFYLYFAAKGDIVNAVVEEMVDGLVDAVERAVTVSTTGAVAKLLALRDVLLALAEDPTGRELAASYHRPENRAVHDRMAARITPRLVPLVEQIVRQGVAEGVFTAEDPCVAAWFVLGGLHALESAFTDRAALPAAIGRATECALRALGCNVLPMTSTSRRSRRGKR